MRRFTLKRILKQIFILLGIATVVSFFFDGFDLFSSWSAYLKSVGYGMLIGGSFWLNNSLLGRYTGHRFSWFRNSRKASMVTLWVYIFSGAVLSLVIPYFYFKYVFRPSPESFWFIVIFNSFIAYTVDLIFVSYFYSLYLVKQLTESLQKEERLERENILARYETLKNQVNPHFLFNSLNTLSGIVEKNSDKAIEYIRKLADIYRYVLEQKDKELIPVDIELEFVNDFIYLEKIRHGEALQFTCNIRSKKTSVSPLALQMLLENAVKHNVISDEYPLHIEITEEKGYFVVKNNLQKRKVVRKNHAVGLENLRRRYEFLSNKKIIIEETGTHFIVKIPVIQSLSK
jgi:two-component system, LytTR family, sensor kinase